MLVSKRFNEPQVKKPEGAALAPSLKPAAEVPVTETPPKRATRPVTAAEVYMVRRDDLMTPIDRVTVKGTRWKFRHPDVDGSGYTGTIHLAQLDRYVQAEDGFITTDRPEERDALKALGWVLWGTEVPDARPFGSARPV